MILIENKLPQIPVLILAASTQHLSQFLLTPNGQVQIGTWKCFQNQATTYKKVNNHC